MSFDIDSLLKTNLDTDNEEIWMIYIFYVCEDRDLSL